MRFCGNPAKTAFILSKKQHFQECPWITHTSPAVAGDFLISPQIIVDIVSTMCNNKVNPEAGIRKEGLTR